MTKAVLGNIADFNVRQSFSTYSNYFTVIIFFLCGGQGQNQPSVRFFSAFDDLTNLQNIIFSNLIPNPQQPPPEVNY